MDRLITQAATGWRRCAMLAASSGMKVLDNGSRSAGGARRRAAGRADRQVLGLTSPRCERDGHRARPGRGLDSVRSAGDPATWRSRKRSTR
jgi:hypothetical protein